EQVFGIQIGTAPCIIGGSFLMVLTTIYGFRGLQRLADLAVPVLLLALVAVAWRSALGLDAATLWTAPDDPASLGIGISAVIGGLAVGITIFPDLARFARSPRHAQGAAIASYGVGVPVVLLLAAIPSIVTGERDLIMIMTGLGLGIPALVFMVFTAWTTNSGNLYSSSLGLANVFTRPSFPVLAGVAGIIGTVFALLGVSARLLPFLVMLGVTIPPIAGIYLADFFLVRRQQYDEAELEGAAPVAWPAFAAWGLAVAVALLSARQGITITGVPACDSIVIASAVYGGLAFARRARRRRMLSRGSSS
ncbi:MAG TPA: cytosine permease, partial [Sphingomonadales bacterium]